MKGLHYVLIFAVLMLATCKEESNTLTASETQVAFGSDGGSTAITISTTADSWTLTNQVADWLNVSSTSGSGGESEVTLSVTTRTLEPRTGTLTIVASDADPLEITVTQASSDHLYVIATDLNAINAEQAGSTKSLKITTDAPIWNISANVDWLQFSSTTGNKGNTTVTITASENTSDNARQGVITISASNAAPLEIPITQKGPLYPSYNTSPLAADATGMSSNAVELAAKINLGFNIGNSLEATGGETAWGSPMITKEFVDLVKANGFNAIRLPCSWNQNMENSTTAKLKIQWLNRVKEVIQYCVDNDMYVLLNIHWDGGWLENNCTPAKQIENNAKQKAFWEQIATHMRDFDEHLLFASANEPNVENSTQMAVLDSYHQTFVTAVRSTGGRNSYRVLVVQGPSTDVEKTNTLMGTLPTDEIEDRMMVEVHYYTPWNFCGLTEDADWGKMFYYWGADYHSTTDPDRNATWGEEETVITNLNLMKTKFVDQGIPVIMGEYGAALRSSLTGENGTLHRASRAYYLKYVTQQAIARGILPFFWDNGSTDNNNSALFDRDANTVFDKQALDALLEGAQ